MISPYRSDSGRYFNWSLLVANAKKRPGKYLLLPNETVRLVKIIKQSRHRVLQELTDGHLQVERVNIHLDRNMTKRADLYVRFVPNPKERP